MTPIRRVTLRCLCDDLYSDWEVPAQRGLYQEIRSAIAQSASDGAISDLLHNTPSTILAAHPLVVSFAAAFDTEDPDVQRESISGLSNPHWWKQKVARWRGAATDADMVGSHEVWLCAGGIRAAGESRDFYATFTREVTASGAPRYLPSAEDRQLQRVEEKLARFEAWLDQIRLAALVGLLNASRARHPIELHIPRPSPKDVADPLLHLTLKVEVIGEDDGELTEVLLTSTVVDHSMPMLANEAESTVRALVQEVADDWRVLPGADGSLIWSAVARPNLIALAAEAADSGSVPDALRKSSLKLGVQAHFTRSTGIVDATVEGSAVRALCGFWFVPTTNPDGLEVCPTCQTSHQSIPS